ncbi:MAG: LytR C-terminal domain-containing protein [Actinomycetota bacterium]
MRALSATRFHPNALAVLAATVALTALVACNSSSNAIPTATTKAPGADTSTTANTSSGATTTSASTTTSTTTIPPTTIPPTTTLPIVTSPGKVKVAISSGINGAGGQLSVQLAARGFTLTNATNAFGPDKDLRVTKIYVSKGSEKVADSISRLMGGPKVYPMPTPAWIEGGTAALEGATVLVMLGSDKADKKLSEMAG